MCIHMDEWPPTFSTYILFSSYLLRRTDVCYH